MRSKEHMHSNDSRNRDGNTGVDARGAKEKEKDHLHRAHHIDNM